MKKDEIISELDKLKLKILLDLPDEKSRDIEEFETWCDGIMGRAIKDPFDWQIFSNETYIKYRNVVSLVQQLYYDQNYNSYAYQRDRSDIRRMIKNIVAMTMFIQEKTQR